MRIVVIFFLLFCPLLSLASVTIIEVMCNPVGSDTNGEWVKIKNTGTDSVDITGWKFNDGSNHNLNIPPKNNGVGDMILSGGEEALLANKAEHVTGLDTVIDTVMSLNNSFDTISLINGDTTESSITYTVADGSSEGELCYGTSSDSSSGSSTTGTGATSSPTQTNIVTTEVTKYNTVTIEPPQDIHLRVSSPTVSNVGVRVNFLAELYDATGKIVDSANVQWSFGDGYVAKGLDVRHLYKYTGEYAVSVYAKRDKLYDEQIVKIKIVPVDASVYMSDDYEFVEVFNNSDANLDVSKFVLRSGYMYFYIPERTILLPKSSVRFSIDITKLSNLRREKHVLLLDAVRNKVADSREYVAKNEITKQDNGESSAAETTQDEQDSSGTHSAPATVLANSSKKTLFKAPPPTPITVHKARVARVSLVKETPSTESAVANTQMAAAVVSIDSLSTSESGVRWLLGLFAIICMGMILFQGFNFPVSKDEDDVDISNFSISEIK